MAATVSKPLADSVQRINGSYLFKNPAELSKYYDDWATTYDSEVLDTANDYVGPVLTAAAALKAAGPSTIAKGEILDAGCGTGLVGVALKRLGATKVDGLDISPKMLDIARQTGAYRDLETADLTRAMSTRDASYDVVVCAGTFTHSHVGPNALAEFVRVLRPDGFMAATIVVDLWESAGFKEEVERLVATDQIKIVSCEVEDYRPGANVRAKMLVVQKIVSA